MPILKATLDLGSKALSNISLVKPRQLGFIPASSRAASSSSSKVGWLPLEASLPTIWCAVLKGMPVAHQGIGKLCGCGESGSRELVQPIGVELKRGEAAIQYAHRAPGPVHAPPQMRRDLLQVAVVAHGQALADGQSADTGFL